MNNYSLGPLSNQNDIVKQSSLSNFERTIQMRRKSLGILPSMQNSSLTQNDIDSFSPIFSGFQQQHQQQQQQPPNMQFSSKDQFELGFNDQNRFNSILMSLNNTQELSRSRSAFFTQNFPQNSQNKSQILDQQNQQDNVSSFMRYGSFSGNSDFNNQYLFQSVLPTSSSSTNNLDASMKLSALRRRSFGPIVNTSLKPVHESRSSSPTFSFPNQNQFSQQQSENKLGFLSSSSSLLTTNNNNNLNNSLKISRPSINLSSTPLKSRLRTLSSGSVGSFETFGNQSGLSSALSSTSNIRLDSFEEKLATTGNMFQRREDWSIIGRVPICKQNTIHIRLEDEGPYGNDETRCFVLSHFSSLGIREMNCIFCGCEMPIFDRFPLVDGTLFVSPYCYDKEKSIPANVSNKNQFIYGICLKCLNGEINHEIRCKSCQQLWTGGSSLQIGTLYKYDIFAAFPCCQTRFNCEKCYKPVIELKSGGFPYFSNYSEERECPYCQYVGYHFIKPLDDIYFKPLCALTRKEPNLSFLKDY